MIQTYRMLTITYLFTLYLIIDNVIVHIIVYIYMYDGTKFIIDIFTIHIYNSNEVRLTRKVQLTVTSFQDFQSPVNFQRNSKRRSIILQHRGRLINRSLIKQFPAQNVCQPHKLHDRHAGEEGRSTINSD